MKWSLKVSAILRDTQIPVTGKDAVRKIAEKNTPEAMNKGNMTRFLWVQNSTAPDYTARNVFDPFTAGGSQSPKEAGQIEALPLGDS